MGVNIRRYELFNEDMGVSLKLIDDPENSEDSEKTIKREKTFGIITTLSKNLEFIKKGAEFLREAFEFKGIEARVTMKEFRTFPDKDGEFLHLEGDFDFSKYSSTKTRVKVPFLTGGLNAQIKAQMNQKFEIQKTTSITGANIGELILKDVALTSRAILLISKFETNDVDKKSTSFRMNFDSGNTRTGSLGIPLDIISNSDDKIQNVIKDSSFTTTPNNGEIVSVFYLNNDVTKTLKIDFDVFSVIREIKVDDLSNEFMQVDLVKFNNGATLDFVSRTTLSTVNMSQINGFEINFTDTQTVTLLAGESLSLQWFGGGDFGGLFNDGDLKVDFTETKAKITITEESIRDDSQTKAILMNDVGDRLMKVITGEENRYFSDFFTNGDFKLMGITYGLWIRQFFEKKISISLKDFLDTTNFVLHTGHTIQKINGVDTLVHEDMRYFFQDQVGITLPIQISDVERKPATDLYFSNIDYGYDKPKGEELYEESMGLTEYNTKTSATFPITRVDKKLNTLSKWRADPNGKEFARRKSKLDFAEEDTRYDRDVFLLDLKEGLGTALEERLFQDDFETEPTGIFSPETATNLRITPFRNLERRGFFIRGGFQKFKEDFIRVTEIIGNSDLSTKKVGEVIRSESADIPIKELERPLFENEWVTFNHVVDFNINEQVFGETVINGRKVPNFFLKVKYLNENLNFEFGYLFELNPDKEGKWKILRAV